MTFEAIYLGRYRCEPGPARTYAQDLRELGQAAGETEDAYIMGLSLGRREFAGQAGDSFRAQCASRMAAAAELSANMGHLSEAASEAADDAHDLAVLLDEMVAIAHTGGLVVSGDAIHPPDNEVRLEDTPALVQGWQAWDQLTSRHATIDASYQQSIDDLVRAIAHYGYSEWARSSVPQGPWIPDTHHHKGSGLPEEPYTQDRILPKEHPASDAPGLPDGHEPHHESGRFDGQSRARWIEGHRSRDGEWVHAHWQPVGHDGHGGGAVAATWVDGVRDDGGKWVPGHWDDDDANPHAGEHSSGATTAQWVDGRWEPVVPEFHPPSIALRHGGT